MTLNDAMEIVIDEILKTITKAMETAQSEESLLSIYLQTLNLFKDITSVPISHTAQFDESKFIKLSEDAIEKIWKLFTQNLNRVGSKMAEDPIFHLMKPAEIFQRVKQGKTTFVMPPAQMVQ